MQTRIHAIASGRVQGVFYRAFCEDEATRFDITGTVRNLDDGTVELIVEGNEEECQRFLDSVNVRKGAIFVDEMRIKKESATGEFNGFKIIY